MSNNNSETLHQNSRKVTIFRAINFMQRAQKDEAAGEFMSMAAQAIGPYFQSHTSKIIGSGLSIPEQELLMPHMLSIDATDREFRKSVFEFFNSLTTKVPFSTGMTLEIGLTENNEKPLSKANMPINIEHYIRWRHAKNHPWVAGSRADSEANQLKKFYIHDTELQFKEDTDKMVLQDKADEIWLKIKNSSEKVGMLLTLLGFDVRDYLGRNEEQKKQNVLRDYIDKNAPQFLKVYETDRFEMKYWLKAMVTAGVVQLVNTSYMVKETNKLLGRSELEAILYLEDPNNADTLMFLKGSTQDVLRKPRSGKSVKKLA